MVRNVKRDEDGVVMWEEGRPRIEESYPRRKAALERDKRAPQPSIAALVEKIERENLKGLCVFLFALGVCCMPAAIILLHGLIHWLRGGG